jgi:hypothetical protein
MSGVSSRRNQENALRTFRHAGFLLALLLPVMGVAFWKSYISILNDLPERFTWTLHVHSALMAGWVVMLPAQAWFMRSGRMRLHRLIGRASYVYAPITILSGVVTMRGSLMSGPDGVTFELARDAVFQHMMLVSLAITWGLAIAYRRQPQLHIRFMISTVFAISTAIFFRIFIFWVPGFDTFDTAAHGNFAVIGVLLSALIANDWRLGVRRSPFLVITALIGAQYLCYRTVAPMQMWNNYCDWLVSHAR